LPASEPPFDLVDAQIGDVRGDDQDRGGEKDEVAHETLLWMPIGRRQAGFGSPKVTIFAKIFTIARWFRS